MTADQGAALTLWLLAAGFGLPAPFVGLYLLRRDELPSFFGLFRVYGGGFFEAFPKTIFVLLLAASQPSESPKSGVAFFSGGTQMRA
jgi:hypothetical protein